MMRLLICDDEPERLAEWQERLGAVEVVQAEFELVALEEGALRNEIAELEARRVAARRGDGRQRNASQIDEADLLVVDYDLALLDPETYQTGEGIAYLARCFSTCGFIVGLNQFGENPFDLTLRGHPESFADLNLGGEQLHNPGLWSLEFPSFRPWSWPLLPRAVESLDRRIREIDERLDDSIYEYFGLSDGRLAALPRSAEQFVARKLEPSEATFRTFVRESGSALRGRDTDVQLEDATITRIAASRLAKWLERVILPGQDALVDAPHLALRFPSLLRGDVDLPSSWSATVASLGGEETGLEDATIDTYRFARADWLLRPAWWWQPVSNDEAIPEVADPWGARGLDIVFAEDTSRFVPADQAREFVADLTSPFARRFVEGPSEDDAYRRGVTYEPAVSFAIA